MTAAADHNKLVKQAAKSVLNPAGLFQKASTRMWIDDNGWYLILVEFQPSMWSKGSYLNVGIHYLWDARDYLGFDYGYRISGFVEYKDDDDAFLKEMLLFAEKAREKVLQYRQFRDMEYAKQQICSYRQSLGEARRLYHNMMICGLCRDLEAKTYYTELMDMLPRATSVWEKAYYRELTESIAPLIEDPVGFQNYICEKILRQKGFWRTKSGMKKLKEAYLF